MKATIVELRYKMKEVLKALDRKERVQIMYRGKPKGVIIPMHEHQHKSVKDSSFFGSSKNEKKSVKQVMEELRGGRYHGI